MSNAQSTAAMPLPNDTNLQIVARLLRFMRPLNKFMAMSLTSRIIKLLGQIAVLGIAAASIVVFAALLFAHGDRRSRLYLSHPKPSKARAQIDSSPKPIDSTQPPTKRGYIAKWFACWSSLRGHREIPRGRWAARAANRKRRATQRRKRRPRKAPHARWVGRFGLSNWDLAST